MTKLTKLELAVCARLSIDGSRLVHLYRALDGVDGQELEIAFLSRTTAALLIGFRQGRLYEKRTIAQR